VPVGAVEKLLSEPATDSTDGKLAKLKALGIKRHRADLTTYGNTYKNLADFPRCDYETDWVSPFTNCANNADSPIVIVLQDWSSEDELNGPCERDLETVGYSITGRTGRNNQRLKDVLRATYGLEFEDVFITNLFPFIKRGDISAKIPAGDLRHAFRDYCWPQIEAILPTVVVCLGGDVYKTFVRCLAGVGGPAGTHFNHDGKAIYHQRHPAARGADPYGQMLQGWKRMTGELGL